MWFGFPSLPLDFGGLTGSFSPYKFVDFVQQAFPGPSVPADIWLAHLGVCPLQTHCWEVKLVFLAPVHGILQAACLTESRRRKLAATVSAW